MFGLFGGKKKFISGVREEILKLVNIVKVPETNETIKIIQKEMKENGASADDIESVKFNLIVAETLSQPLEHDLDHMYKNFDEVQAAFYCISSYITHVYNSGQLSEYEKDQPEMYSALKLLWYVCAGAIENNYEAFAKCIIVPGENPFPD